ncbi:hypothetical protein PO903_10885 [Paenibacillus sp. PK4536]|uniref:phage tail terminator family protein n=1 Tax=Paenibacillus sp. PK4536 TaxID=3024576 RepID=UPI0023580C2B|nr:hypothetical protein [Paenibacillus sp. PK4536]WIM41344.1 hypothetical protein PO903_10885 [Paenibacillus sp. PK4536]
MDAQEVIHQVQLSLTTKFPNVPFYRADQHETEQPRIEYRLVSVDFTRERSDRFVRMYTLEIRYILKTGESPDYQTESLFEALETIGHEDTLCRASELRWDTDDGIPRMRVNYPVRTVKPPLPGVLMGELDQHLRAVPQR